jgi:non-homologous end joining protein Ku
MKGKKITLDEPEQEPADAKVLDLMSRLQASLQQHDKGGARGRKGAKAKTKKTAAPRRRKVAG